VAPAQVQVVFPQLDVTSYQPPVQANTGQIAVRQGKAAKLPTFYVGALRIQVVSVGRDKSGPTLKLRVTPEPRMQGFSIVGTPSITKALDEHGQDLDLVMGEGATTIEEIYMRRGIRYYRPNTSTATTETTVLLKDGAKASTQLKELTGKLTLQVLTATELAAVKDVLKAGGKKAKGKDGSSLELVSITKLGNNRYQVTTRVEQGNNNGLGNVFIQGNVVIRGNVIINGRRVSSSNNMPVLLDKKGREYRYAGLTRSSMRGINGVWSREMTVIYEGGPHLEEPDQLVLRGQMMETVQAPFRFENVKLR
jgi:hypothetical protein